VNETAFHARTAAPRSDGRNAAVQTMDLGGFGKASGGSPCTIRVGSGGNGGERSTVGASTGAGIKATPQQAIPDMQLQQPPRQARSLAISAAEIVSTDKDGTPL
jgi:hypothetical protein